MGQMIIPSSTKLGGRNWNAFLIMPSGKNIKI